MWTKEQIGYLAGIIDGEGSIYVQKQIKKTGFHAYNLRFQVMNTSKELIAWLQETFGGVIYERKSKNPKWKDRYEWWLYHKKFDEIAPHILPFLIIKKKQLEIAIEFRKTFFHNTPRVSEEIKCFRDDCISQISLLNKKGPKLPSALLPSC